MSSSRDIFFSIDWKLLVPAIVLVVLSLTTLFSVNIDFFKNQLVYFVISLVAFFAFAHTNYKGVRLYALPIYIVSLGLLFVVLLIGSETRGAVRWLDFMGFRIQFSEILKPFLAISFAALLAGRSHTLTTFLLAFLLLAPVAFLILIQPDLGSALIYVCAALITLFVAGFSWRYFATIFLLFAACMPVIWQFLHEYQKDRILTFIHPSSDPLGISYNSIQAVIAVGSGMIFGKGLSEGTQSGLKFLPEYHSDFIFATFTEGVGFVGALVLITAFGFLLYRLYTICRDAEDVFSKLFVSLTFSIVIVQFFVNIGMNIGIVPIVGITLPFVSYGGSSLLSSFILLGIVSAISTGSKKHEVLEIR